MGSETKSSMRKVMVVVDPSREAAGALQYALSHVFLEAMKHLCEAAKPRLKVKVERLQMGAKDKASVILFKSTAMAVDHLIIGQKNTKYKKPGGIGPKSLDTAEYLIEYSKCNCVGVQKKGQTGGYLLNTKSQKNFWLLA
ncbi:hypothetical protein LINPERPRIM_LOCUS5439 [Linum perenne]